MKINIVTILSFALFLLSCENSQKSKSNQTQKIDYSNKTVLDSLIKTTAQSNDTIFLGFKIGMTKSEYKNQIEKLKKEDKTITFSKSNRISTIAGTFDLGEGYTFKTSISSEKNGKTLTGNGQYFLEPVYNQNGNLMQLNIVPIEKWDNEYDSPKWLENRVKQNSDDFTDNDLKQALIDNKFISNYDFIRKKGNVVIYDGTLTITYIDLKTLLLELLIKETEKDIIKEKNSEIEF